jgi:hypothetical protein
MMILDDNNNIIEMKTFEKKNTVWVNGLDIDYYYSLL